MDFWTTTYDHFFIFKQLSSRSLDQSLDRFVITANDRARPSAPEAARDPRRPAEARLRHASPDQPSCAPARHRSSSRRCRRRDQAAGIPAVPGAVLEHEPQELANLAGLGDVVMLSRPFQLLGFRLGLRLGLGHVNLSIQKISIFSRLQRNVTK